MGYFETLADSAFEKDEMGNFYVRPYGKLSQPRRFASEDDYHAARSYLIGAYKILICLAIASAIAIRQFGAIGWALAACTIAYTILFMIPRIKRGTESQ